MPWEPKRRGGWGEDTPGLIYTLRTRSWGIIAQYRYQRKGLLPEQSQGLFVKLDKFFSFIKGSSKKRFALLYIQRLE